MAPCHHNSIVDFFHSLCLITAWVALASLQTVMSSGGEYILAAHVWATSLPIPAAVPQAAAAMRGCSTPAVACCLLLHPYKWLYARR